MGLDLLVSMGLQCGTYGARKGLWDCSVGLMGEDDYLRASLGLRCGAYGAPGHLRDCGVGPMGFVGVYGIAVWDL